MKCSNIPRGRENIPRGKNIPRGPENIPRGNECDNIPRGRENIPRGKIYSPRPKKYSPRQNIFPAAEKIFPAAKNIPRGRENIPRDKKIFFLMSLPGFRTDEMSAKYLWIYHQFSIFTAATPNMWGCNVHHVRFCNNQHVGKGCRMQCVDLNSCLGTQYMPYLGIIRCIPKES